jgi:hypothetical protein
MRGRAPGLLLVVVLMLPFLVAAKPGGGVLVCKLVGPPGAPVFQRVIEVAIEAVVDGRLTDAHGSPVVPSDETDPEAWCRVNYGNEDGGDGGDGGDGDNNDGGDGDNNDGGDGDNNDGGDGDGGGGEITGTKDVTVVKFFDPDARYEGVRIEGDGFQIELRPADGEGRPADGQEYAADLFVMRGEGVDLSMQGFAPGSDALLYLQGDPPILLSSAKIGPDGVLDVTNIPLPDDITACKHTLTLIGALPNSTTVEVAIEVWVHAEPSPFSDVGSFSTDGPSVGCLSDTGVVNGFPGGVFGPSSATSRGQAASMIAQLFGLAGAPPPFGDAVGSAHAKGIGALVDAGIMQGFADGSFGPGQALSRGQAASLLATAAGLRRNGVFSAASHDGAKPHLDTEGTGHDDAIEALVAAGIVTVFPGEGATDEPISRGEFATLLAQLEYHNRRITFSRI